MMGDDISNNIKAVLAYHCSASTRGLSEGRLFLLDEKAGVLDWPAFLLTPWRHAA
jgi:hypothetical protein